MTTNEDSEDEMSVVELASINQAEVADRLGDGIDVVSLGGRGGTHTYIADGAEREYLVLPAVMDALKESVDERLWMEDFGSEEEVAERLETQLRDILDPFVAEHVAEQAAETLVDWDEYHRQFRGEDE